MTGRRGSAAHPVRAVTFDLWGTLLELDRRAAARYEEQREKVWIEEAARWPPAPGAEAAVASEREARALVLAETQRDAAAGRSRSIELQGHRMAELLGREYPAGRISAKLGLIVRGLPARVTPRAREVLAELEGTELKLGVVSNLIFEPSESVRSLMAERRLLRHFHHLALSEELPWCKPSPRIFEDCISKLGVEAQNTVHIGDALVDVTGATAARFGGVIVVGKRPPRCAARRSTVARTSRASTPTTWLPELGEVPRTILGRPHRSGRAS